MKSDKALKILKDYIGSGPEVEPVEFDKAISRAIKDMESRRYKPYIAEEQEARTVLELGKARDDEGLFIIKVFLDEQLLHNMWCDRVSVFATRPPSYCFYLHGVNFVGFSARLMVVNPDAKSVITPSTFETLGKYVVVGRIHYDKDRQFKVVME